MVLSVRFAGKCTAHTYIFTRNISRKNVKKLIVRMLAVIMMLSLVACVESGNTESQKPTQKPTEAPKEWGQGRFRHDAAYQPVRRQSVQVDGFWTIEVAW